MATEAERAWGTWQELLLGGAVLRHGAAAWDIVAAELRSRTPFPHLFSPQACEAKFEELQERYSGCDALIEELRKKRVMELKRELEISEDSIGSLQAKLENLSSQREGRSNSMCHTSRTESTKEKACADYPFGEDTSKDGSSAASFAKKKGRLSCSTSNFVDSVSIKENELKMDLSVDSEKQEGLIGYLLQGYASFKKKRSKRKRRIFAIAKRSRGDNEMTTSPACMDGKETLDRKKLDVQQPSEKSYKPASGETSNMVMRRIMDSIMDYKDVSQFQQKLVNQKKANYKKLIRQHVDFPTIKSRIGDGSITSNRELFRDLLLLSNNALVFYPKNSLEHKSALSLLEHVKKIMRENTESPNCRSGGESGDSIADPISAVGKPKKGASIHQCNHSTKRKLAVADEGVVTSDIVTARKAPQSRVPVVYQTNKRGTGRPVTSRADGAVTSDIVTARKAPQSCVPVEYQTNKRGTGRPVTIKADEGAVTSDIVTARKAPQSRGPVEYQTYKRGTGRPVTTRQRDGIRQKESPRKRARRS